jgi:hypothetical protein
MRTGPSRSWKGSLVGAERAVTFDVEELRELANVGRVEVVFVGRGFPGIEVLLPRSK